MSPAFGDRSFAAAGPRV